MAPFFSSVVVGWVLRRALELGGLVGTGLTIWNNLDPELQGVVLSLLSRNWENITLGSLVPVALSVWGYAWSFISTRRNQVVVDGKQVPIRDLGAPQQQIAVEEIARTAITKRERKTLAQLLAEKIGKRWP